MSLNNAAVDTLDWTAVKLGHFQPPNRQGAPSLTKPPRGNSKFLILRRTVTLFIELYKNKKTKKQKQNLIVFKNSNENFHKQGSESLLLLVHFFRNRLTFREAPRFSTFADSQPGTCVADYGSAVSSCFRSKMQPKHPPTLTYIDINR